MVKVIGVDRDGKIKLSRKALLPEPEGVAAGAGGDRGDRGDRGGDRGYGRGDRGDRPRGGGDRGRRR
jgi:polyribonucleotide nucleotidyltransferase